MIYAHVSDTKRESNNEYWEFMNQNKKDIKKTVHYKDLIILKNGDEHYFKCDIGYIPWCKGKIYMLDGVLMRSGYKLRQKGK